MPKVTLSTIGSRYGSVDALNDNFDLIEDAFDNTLSLDGSTPNEMAAPLNMGGNRVINVEQGVNNTDGVNLQQVNNLINAASTGLIASQREVFTATAGQTLITINNFTYLPGANNLAVYRNGVRMYSGDAYNELTNNTFQFTEPLELGDRIEAVSNEAVATSAALAENVSYTPQGAGAIATSVASKLREFVSVKDFGADGTATSTDQSSFIQLAVNSGAKRIWVPAGTYSLATTIFVPVGVEIWCEPRSVVFRPRSGGTLTDGYLFIWNSTDGATWTTSFPNTNAGGLYNAEFQNPSNIASAKGVELFCPAVIQQCKFDNFTQSITKPASFYIDGVVLRHIFAQNPQGNTEYQIDLQGLGDGLVIEDVHAPYNTIAAATTKAVKLRGCNGGVISASVAGDYLFELCDGVLFTGFHLEQSQVIVDSSSIKFLSGQMYPTTRTPFVLQGTAADGGGFGRWHVDFDSVQFVWVEGLFEFNGFFVQLSPGMQCSFRNVYRKWTTNEGLNRSQLAGIRICQADGSTGISDFNNLSYLMSANSYVGANYAVSVDHSIRMLDAAFTGLTSTQVSTSGLASESWKIATGTYYYQAQLVYDTVRAVGKSSAAGETSVTVSGTNALVITTVNYGTKPRQGFVKLYRGTAPGSYNSFVIIPVVGSALLYDNGTHCNGFAWESRGAGAVDAINSTGELLKFWGKYVEFWTNATPTTGTWTQADVIRRTNSTVDGSNMLIYGQYRLTTGSGHNTTTDWAFMRTSTVSPAT
jgi:hypothetical protein